MIWFLFIEMNPQTKKTVLVPIGEGFEEIETVTIVDVLRRAEADVTLASVILLSFYRSIIFKIFIFHLFNKFSIFIIKIISFFHNEFKQIKYNI